MRRAPPPMRTPLAFQSGESTRGVHGSLERDEWGRDGLQAGGTAWVRLRAGGRPRACRLRERHRGEPPKEPCHSVFQAREGGLQQRATGQGCWRFPGTTHVLTPHTKAKTTPWISMAVEPDADEVVLEAPAHFRIYKSGKIDRLNRDPVLPAGVDEATGVTSKDVVLDADTGLSVRLYLPRLHEPSNKLPVLVYLHGGAFLIGSADSATYHSYVNALAAAAGVLAVSVDYRLAPEHPIPAAYDDCWAALQWAASAQDDWIAEQGDTARLFLAGDSAGANIAHEMLVRAGSNNGPRIEGAILLHPWFGGCTAIEGEPQAAAVTTRMIWSYAFPGAVGGADDPRMNPLARGAPALEKLGCERMLVSVGQSDGLAARGREYYEAVAASGWRGTAAWLGSDGEDHVFFLEKPGCENAKQLMDRVGAFIAAA